MNILLISQCSGRAINETRRILNQFAERRGERTWQTPITQQGLDTLRRLLRKTARRNTAVACHWIRGRDHSELVWIVGDAKRFNVQGAVPTNTTQRDVLRSQDENDWHTGEDIRLLAKMAALFHDMGKASAAFQHKLTSKKLLRDAYRHEWISLRLFEAFVGKRPDDEWLRALANLPDKPSDMGWMDSLIKDGMTPSNRSPFSKLSQLPPLAQVIGWLVVSHHRLPVQTSDKAITQSLLNKLPVPISADWNAARADANEKEIAECWKLDKKTLPFVSASWRKKVSQCAQRMLARPHFMATPWLENAYALHLARLVLMLADHYYSMQPANPHYGDINYPLYANTDRDTRTLKQRLDEHLIGVGEHARKITGVLPRLNTQLPRLAQHKGFKKRTKLPRFRWQDKAYDLAFAIQQRSEQQGFFGINMASTGCGKTLANGRIMYALANQQLGTRFSIALGLRTLTLQTGQAYRERLDLGADELAVMVGGAAVRELFEMNQTDSQNELSQRGSESAQDLLPDNTHVFYESSLEDSPLRTWLEKNPRAHKLLNAPVLTCTIDHLMPATEGIRGGHQIVPMLRLMTSDLVLDEPDDFALEDLPALSRLVHWAGLLGSRVLLSSATLPPALVQGLFESYKTGREIYQKNRGIPGYALAVCCAWFDEFNAHTSDHSDSDTFAKTHDSFVKARLSKLGSGEVRRVAEIKPLVVTAKETKQIRVDLAEQVMPLLHGLHRQHHSVDPATNKRLSFGLFRMANIDPLIDVACALLALGAENDSRIHLCVYHSRHPLLIRSAIEQQLDRLLNRTKPEAVFADPEIRQLLDTYSETDHIVLVLGSPVTEVGRDHDYDWAVIEPSSMRSIIQLAGRIRRHRPGTCVESNPNLYLLDTNVKSLEQSIGIATFCKPGFESKDFLLTSHSLSDLLTQEQIGVINAKPRIALREPLQPRDNLVDLEHACLQTLMQGDLDQSALAVPPWWRTRAHLTAELQRTQRFRNSQPEERFALLPDDDEQTVTFQREVDGCWTDANKRLITLDSVCGPRISFWGAPDYLTALSELAETQEMEFSDCAKKFGVLQLPKGSGETQASWQYHPALGFRRDKH
jgi:CRISPR-associated endonuclease/helicase Cas3